MKRNLPHSIAWLFAASLLFFLLPVKASANPGEHTIRQLTNQWTAGWNIGAEPFDAEAFRPLFAPSGTEIEVFDNVQGDVIVLSSVDEYIETWKPFMEPLTHWSVEMNDLKVRVSGDLATTTFRLDGTDTRGSEGEPVSFGQYGTHVWQRFSEHGWRIVHEHLTSYQRATAEPSDPVTSIRSIDHVSISTNNPNLVAWYRTVLDFEIEDQWTAPDVVPGLDLMYLIHPSGTRLEVAVGDPVASPTSIPGSVPEDFAKPGFRHLCFEVDSVDEVLALAKARGATVLAEPFDFPYLKKRLAFIQDPDGNAIEFVQPIIQS